MARDSEVVGMAVERLVVSATRLWRVVVGAETASPAGRTSLALVAAGLTRSFDDLAEAIEIVLADSDAPAVEVPRELRRGGGR